jgi:hypothetical protein
MCGRNKRRLLYTLRENPGYTLGRRLCGFQNLPGRSEEEEILDSIGLSFLFLHFVPAAIKTELQCFRLKGLRQLKNPVT